jgi:2-polyprenyl-6-methoxyphenol hydroxylase-like FAD-dependent oxidoreductase
MAHWVIGTDGYRSVVRRDLRAGFRPIDEPRTASIIHVVGRRSVDVEGAVQISIGEHAVHTVWPLGDEQLLWVMQTTGPEIPAGLEFGAPGQGPVTPITLSTDPVCCGTVSQAFVEKEAELVGIQVQEVLSEHAIHFRPSVADPQGRGRAWTSGPAAQVIAPALGHDDTLGLLEVPDLALLLGFGADDGMSGLPTLTPRLYHERRARIQQRLLGAHPLGRQSSGSHQWSNYDRGSDHDREAVANVLAFLAPMAPAARSPDLPSRFGSTSVRA